MNMEKVYEIWYKFYDGTQANSNGSNEKIKTFKDKKNAINERDYLNANAQFPKEKPYYIKEVELADTKRFTHASFEGEMVILNNDKYISIEEVVDLLNELYYENKQLKKDKK